MLFTTMQKNPRSIPLDLKGFLTFSSLHLNNLRSYLNLYQLSPSKGLIHQNVDSTAFRGEILAKCLGHLD